MFRRKKDDETDPRAAQPGSEMNLIPAAAQQQQRPAARPAPAPAASAAPAGRPGAAPPVSAAAAASAAAQTRRPERSNEGEPKKLIVGRDIHLSGEITSCDRLIVQGRVEAQLNHCQHVEIHEYGLFKGAAVIETADIGGKFEGALTVQGRLHIRATGRVEGEVRYGQIEIEPGGEIQGEVRVIEGGARSSGGPSEASFAPRMLAPAEASSS